MLIVQSKSAYDGATPSGASMAIHSLLRLAKHLDNSEFHDKAVETLKLYFRQMEAMPTGSGQLLCELAFLLSTPKEIAIVGEKGDAKTDAMLAALHGTYQPNKIVASSESADGQTLPLLAGKTQVDKHCNSVRLRKLHLPSPHKRMLKRSWSRWNKIMFFDLIGVVSP